MDVRHIKPIPNSVINVSLGAVITMPLLNSEVSFPAVALFDVVLVDERLKFRTAVAFML